METGTGIIKMDARIMSRYMDIINGKTGYLADARRKWKRRLWKYRI